MKIGINLHSDFYFVVLRSFTRVKCFVLLFILIAVFPLNSYSKNYYVKASGNDTNTGLSDDQAWRTIAKVNASIFLPGDTIYFNKGDTWREQLIITSSGNQTAEITFSAYGTGKQPKIIGSSVATVWTFSHKNVWYSYNSNYIDPYSLEYDGNVYFEGQDNTIKWGRTKKNSWQDLKTEFDWTWVQDTLYIFSSTDPNAKYSGVEMAQREYCINLNNKAYITIDGFELAYSGFYGITEGSPRLNVNGLVIKNCHIHHIGIKEYGYGIEAFHSNTIIRNNIIHDSGRRNVSINIYGADVQVNNIIIEGNTLYNGFHTTGVDISGFGSGTINNVVIRNNLIYDDVTEVLDQTESFKSAGIFAERDGVGSISNIYIHNNIIKNTTFNGILLLNIPESFIYNNVFYGVNPNLKEEFNALVQIGGDSDCTIKNNIFYNDVVSTTNSAFSCLHINSSGTITSDYNLFFQPDLNSVSCIRWAGATKAVYSMAEWTQYKADTRQDNHSPIPANPLFVSTFDFHLREGSPAVGAGVYLGLATDFDGNTFFNPPSIGAFEYNSAPTVAPVFQSSVVENTTPSIIELNYNLALANLVPATSSFFVQVNSVARSVNSVSITGTKVLLTLSNPVAYGNTVTFAYTKPATNPLQTPAGGQAANLTVQSVTNRLTAPPPPLPVPVFSGASVENTAPSVIVMSYSLALAASIPPASAFSVMVNSAARSVSSVSVSGTSVSLTLSSPVANGNTVTVAYTSPSSNPLQTSAGGKAVSITAQSVSNRVNAAAPPPVVVPNTPPVIVVNYKAENYSGFTGVLNASGSYDANKENLTFFWEIPDNIPVSSTNTPVIEYLSPVIQNKQTYEFILTVSDGKATQSKRIPVEILPYQPDLKTAEIISIEATDYNLTDEPSLAVDGNTNTMWSCKGTDQSLIIKLKSPFNIKHIMLAFQPGQKKESYFDIYCSPNGETWDLVLTKAKSCSFSGNFQIFDFPDSKAENEYGFIKLVGLGNSVDNWNYVSEFRIFGYPQKYPSEYEDLFVKIYPNPANEIVNILIDEPNFNPDFIKIVSITGKVMYSDKIDPGIRQFQVPVGFRQGIFIVQLGIGKLTLFTQKLVVNN